MLLRILSGFLFAGMSICVKAVSADIPVGQIVFFRSAFALIPLVIFLCLRGSPARARDTPAPGASVALKPWRRPCLHHSPRLRGFRSPRRCPLADRWRRLTTGKKDEG